MTPQETPLPVAVQLYSLRTLPGGFAETLAQVAVAGFSAVETVADHDWFFGLGPFIAGRSRRRGRLVHHRAR